MSGHAWRRTVLAGAAGALFGVGLSISGMVDPGRVLGFLDVAGGHWDPRLAYVLGGALAVAAVAVRLMPRLRHPWLDRQFHLPASGRIDARLLLGAALFGVGWGLAGFCPGPALAGLGFGIPPVVLFVAAMLCGMALHDRLIARPGR